MSASRLKADALTIFKAALAAADPETATHNALRRLKLPVRQFDRIFLVAIGKAAISMAKAAEDFFGSKLTSGIALTRYGHAHLPLQYTKVREAGHPVPDKAGLAAAIEIEALLRELNARDLLITLISGGSSALLTAPVPGLSLLDKQRTTRLLLRAGADIYELNAVRKHLSRLKGGRLAALAYPATVIGLLLSDVVGDAIDVIGSGPTAPDTSTFFDARAVIAKYSLAGRIPAAVREYLQQAIAETPKPSDPLFKNVRNIVVAGNRQAIAAGAAKAADLGYSALVLSSRMQGESREVARAHAAILLDAPAGSCILSGGETTVTVKGTGQGGRNQEFALALGIDIAGVQGALALSAGTDGTDGPTDAAGAFADGRTVKRAAALGLRAQDFLERNDSYNFFQPLNALVKTGPTGTNVMDINIMLKSR